MSRSPCESQETYDGVMRLPAGRGEGEGEGEGEREGEGEGEGEGGGEGWRHVT